MYTSFGQQYKRIRGKLAMKDYLIKSLLANVADRVILFTL